jgi:hypothetical protein
MYAGTNGEVLEAQIFIGIVYYQRLRHMVSDKSQVRATGPTNSLTRQPVQGRKKNGGALFARCFVAAAAAGSLIAGRRNAPVVGPRPSPPLRSWYRPHHCRR